MTTVLEAFEQHIQSVRRLMNFDRDVLEITIDQLKVLRDELTSHHKLGNPRLTAERTLATIERIRENDSLRPRYQTIFNQALVLLVSYFGSAVRDIFRRGVALAIERVPESPILKEELRMTVGVLRIVTEDVAGSIPDLLIESKDISFQDMQSIARTFKTYFQVDMAKTSAVHDVIVGQACRHIIVHTGGMVDDRVIRQLSGATPRSVKPKLNVGEHVQFSPEEVEMVAEAMCSYVAELSSKLSERIGGVV
jgi:hypothetical protein